MKIIQVIPWLGMGGAEIMCENLSYALKELGHEVIVISMFNRRSIISERMEQNNIDIRYLDKKKGFDISMIFKIKKILKHEKPDTIHTHLYTIKYAMPAAISAKIKTKIHTFHSIAQKESGKLSKIVNKYFYKKKNVIPVALSESVKETIINVYGISENKIPVVYNGISLNKCILKESYKFKDNRINLIHVGRMQAVKNHAVIIDAITKLHDEYPNINLLLIGDGELRSNIEDQIMNNNANDYIKLLGTTDNVYQYLHDSDIFIFPSIYEGIPMTIIEAMGTGLPIVASAVGGIPDMITNNESGLLCQPNVDDLVFKIKIFIENEELRKFCGKNSLANSKNYSSIIMAKKYLDIYKN